MSTFKKKGSQADSEGTGAGPVSPDQQPESLSTGAQEAETTPSGEPAKPERKKRYYSPHEVMKKKGCIGCGGMVLAVILAVAGIVAALVVLI